MDIKIIKKALENAPGMAESVPPMASTGAWYNFMNFTATCSLRVPMAVASWFTTAIPDNVYEKDILEQYKKATGKSKPIKQFDNSELDKYFHASMVDAINKCPKTPAQIRRMVALSSVLYLGRQAVRDFPLSCKLIKEIADENPYSVKIWANTIEKQICK